MRDLDLAAIARGSEVEVVNGALVSSSCDTCAVLENVSELFRLAYWVMGTATDL